MCVCLCEHLRARFKKWISAIPISKRILFYRYPGKLVFFISKGIDIMTGFLNTESLFQYELVHFFSWQFQVYVDLGDWNVIGLVRRHYYESIYLHDSTSFRPWSLFKSLFNFSVICVVSYARILYFSYKCKLQLFSLQPKYDVNSLIHPPNRDHHPPLEEDVFAEDSTSKSHWGVQAVNSGVIFNSTRFEADQQKSELISSMDKRLTKVCSRFLWEI